MIGIDAIHREMWSELGRILRDEAPAAAAGCNMTLSAYLKKVYLVERHLTVYFKDSKTDGELFRQCRAYDATMQQQIMADAIARSDQDARNMYENAHLVDYKGAPNGYPFPGLLFYFLERWPELTDDVLSGQIPDVPPFLRKPADTLGTKQPSKKARRRRRATKKASVKDRFTFDQGQALFDGRDLGLPSGGLREILEKLVNSFGVVVADEAFNECSSGAGDTLCKSMSVLRSHLRKGRVPCEIKRITGVGYLIRELSAPQGKKKRVRRR